MGRTDQSDFLPGPGRKEDISLELEFPGLLLGREILGDLQPRLRNLQDRGVVSLLELKADYPDLKLIAISGESEVALATAKEFGAKRAIAKPFSPADLLKVVDEVLAE